MSVISLFCTKTLQYLDPRTHPNSILYFIFFSSNYFVAAASTLMHESKKLREIIEVPEGEGIPEDVLCDAESTLGQAKLLMDSVSQTILTIMNT
jgi:hypothetical protein